MHILRRGSQHGTFAARAAAQAYCIEPVHAARIRRQRSGRTRFIAGGAVWTSARIRLGSRRVIRPCSAAPGHARVIAGSIRGRRPRHSRALCVRSECRCLSRRRGHRLNNDVERDFLPVLQHRLVKLNGQHRFPLAVRARGGLGDMADELRPLRQDRPAIRGSHRLCRVRCDLLARFHLLRINGRVEFRIDYRAAGQRCFAARGFRRRWRLRRRTCGTKHCKDKANCERLHETNLLQINFKFQVL